MVQVGIESENGWRPAKVSAESFVPGTVTQTQDSALTLAGRQPFSLSIPT